MFDDRSDEQLSMEDPGARCFVYGFRQSELIKEATLTRVLAELTEKQADKVLNLWHEQENAVLEYVRNNPTKAPTWVFGEYEGADDEDEG